MNRLTLACSVLLTACFGCAGIQSIGFGPFPSSSIAGGSLAGVAAFVPGIVPDDGEFSLIVFNTDGTAIYDVTVTPAGSTATTKQVNPCNPAYFTAGCDVGTVVISVTTTGLETPATLTLMPDSSCKQQVVYIVATNTTTTGDQTATDTPEGETPTTTDQTTIKTVTLTQTTPIEAAACGLGI
jgi:hypothetical protein